MDGAARACRSRPRRHFITPYDTVASIASVSGVGGTPLPATSTCPRHAVKNARGKNDVDTVPPNSVSPGKVATCSVLRCELCVEYWSTGVLAV